jgi:hypothetical protein
MKTKDFGRKKIVQGMKEFQYTEGSDLPINSVQFDEWYDVESQDFEYFRVTDFKVNTCRNSSGRLVETLFVLFKYKVAIEMDYTKTLHDYA